MSILMLAWLLGYGVLRTGLWVRGQWRLRRLMEGLPRASAPAVAPPHVAAPLRDLLASSHERRVGLVESARTIATVLIVDPDVHFGVVRDVRYRFALARAWSEARAWLRAWDSLGEEERRGVEELGCSGAVFRERSEALGRTARRCVRAPALEPFEVGDVAATQGVVEALVRELEGLERAVATGSRDDPYRA